MSSHRYAHESHVEMPETNGWRPTQHQVRQAQHIDQRRRERAALARQRVKKGEPA